MNYKEQLRHGKWQKKRLLVMARDGFKCTRCPAEGDLVVHHLKYFGRAWDAKSNDLVTFCQPCHQKEHNQQNLFKMISFIKTVFEMVLETPYAKEKSIFIYKIGVNDV